MATPDSLDFRATRSMTLRSSKRAKLGVHHVSSETDHERDCGVGLESSTALGKKRAFFHFFKDIPLDILGEVSRSYRICLEHIIKRSIATR